MYKEDTSYTIKTGVENMSPKEVVNLLRQTVWAKNRKKRLSSNHSIIQSATVHLQKTDNKLDLPE